MRKRGRPVIEREDGYNHEEMLIGDEQSEIL